MTRVEHLSAWDLILTARSPVHVGSGYAYAKTDYLFNPRSEMVSVINPDALFDWLYKRRLADRYESFVLSGETNMYRFLKECGITEEELDELCLYRVNAADALDANHSLKEIRPFVRDSRHRAYIPGSSVKGMLRTVLLAGMIAKGKRGVWPDAPKKNARARQMQELEGEYLNTLALKRDRQGAIVNDPVNSILRGLSVSDSEPIPEKDLILAGKIDADEKGRYKALPLCRECIRPGTTLKFKLTLDHSVLPDGFSAETLMQAIQEFDAFYQRTYVARFTPPPGAHAVSYQKSLILGGGSGFFAKSLAYPYLGAGEGMRCTERVMSEQFPRHGHEKDISLHGISPHTMKYGKYRGELYPYGVCEVKIT